jgi:hypothetical protein
MHEVDQDLLLILSAFMPTVIGSYSHMPCPDVTDWYGPIGAGGDACVRSLKTRRGTVASCAAAVAPKHRFAGRVVYRIACI